MRVPSLVWMRRHNVASLTVSFGRIWHTADAGDSLILGYNATGRLARVVFLNPAQVLSGEAGPRQALEAALHLMRGCEGVRPADLEVVLSALGRCPAQAPESSYRSESTAS